MYKKGRVSSNSRIISTDENPSLRIESSGINLRGVSTKLNKYIVFIMQTYKKLKAVHVSKAGVQIMHGTQPKVKSTHIEINGETYKNSKIILFSNTLTTNLQFKDDS